MELTVPSDKQVIRALLLPRGHISSAKDSVLDRPVSGVCRSQAGSASHCSSGPSDFETRLLVGQHWLPRALIMGLFLF